KYFVVRPCIGFSPPFIIDPPCFPDGFDRHRLSHITIPHSAFRTPHFDLGRRSDSVELHHRRLRNVYGPKSVRSIPHSAFRIPHCLTVHNRSTRTAARGGG